MAAAEMPEAESAAHCECESDAEAEAESAGFRPDAPQVQHTTVTVVYLGFSRGFALLEQCFWTALCSCLYYSQAGQSAPFGPAACLRLAKTMPLAGCVSV